MNMHNFGFFRNLAKAVTRFFENLTKKILAIALFCAWLLVFVQMVSPLVKIPIIGTLQTVIGIVAESVIAAMFCTIVLSLTSSRRASPKAMCHDVLVEENKEQARDISRLKDEIALVKGAQYSAQNLKPISEVALLECAMKQNDVKRETLSTEKGKGLFADTITKESLVIHANEVRAKFGVDFGRVRVKKHGKTLFVSGIVPKYIGSDMLSTRCILSEIRETKTKNNISETQILNRKTDTVLAKEKEREAVAEWQERLSQGIDIKFIDEPVRIIAQEHIKLVFAPLGMQIEFTDEEESCGMSIFEFLEKEEQSKEAEISFLKNKNEQIVRCIA